jgi:hypothetical protein
VDSTPHLRIPPPRRAAPAATLALLIGLGLAAPAAAQQPRFARPGELPALDAATRAAVVDSVAAAIDSIYVLGDAAGRIVAHLRGSLAGGAYDSITDPALLARRLESDAQGVHHDGHFGIRALPPAAAPARAGERTDPGEAEHRQRILRATNYGFEKAEILTGNVGYLKFNRFAATDVDPAAGEAATAAMNFLANTDALILDLRENGGGNASMIRLLAGYLFRESTHLINWDIRAEKRTDQSWSADHVPGRRLPDIPVYVLTSRNTFSAAEEFTFDLQHLKRATIVGDTTGGGGHTVVTAEFAFDGFRVAMRIPHGRAYDPRTGRGWDGTGVIPDVPVSAAQALATAHAEALDRLVREGKDAEFRQRREWALEGLRTDLHPVHLSRGDLGAFVGTYGPRRVFLRDGALWYQREDRPPYRLEPMGGDSFRIRDLEIFRVGFARSADGRVVRLIGRYDDGNTDENERTGR